jgi:hypothetical protein
MVCPLCLRIGACLRLDFCHKFLKWFLKYYYTMYVGGFSGVGFDTKTEIEEIERVFRALVLPDFITVMDAVHMSYDRTPFPVRHLFIGKEGYPTVDVNMHSNDLHRTSGTLLCPPPTVRRTSYMDV